MRRVYATLVAVATQMSGLMSICWGWAVDFLTYTPVNKTMSAIVIHDCIAAIGMTVGPKQAFMA